MTRPQLGLLLERRVPDALPPLLFAAARWCQPVSIDPAMGWTGAVLTTAALANRVPDAVRLALWARTREELDSAPGGRAAAIVSDEPGLVEAAGHRGVLATTAHAARGRRPISPFVRERLRAARRLPAVAVLEQTATGWTWTGLDCPLTGALISTAMACASAVSVRTPEALLEGMAWAAPCVAEPEAASEVGAVAGSEVLVAGSESERGRLATALAGDRGQAARLSWAGRRLVERRYDRDRSALRLMDLLSLWPSADGWPTACAELQLATLGTPDDARIVHRVADAVARVCGDSRR